MTDMLIVTGLIFEVLEHRADLIIVSSSAVACEALDRSLQTRFLNLNRGLIYHHQIWAQSPRNPTNHYAFVLLARDPWLLTKPRCPGQLTSHRTVGSELPRELLGITPKRMRRNPCVVSNPQFVTKALFIKPSRGTISVPDNPIIFPFESNETKKKSQGTFEQSNGPDTESGHTEIEDIPSNYPSFYQFN